MTPLYYIDGKLVNFGWCHRGLNVGLKNGRNFAAHSLNIGVTRKSMKKNFRVKLTCFPDWQIDTTGKTRELKVRYFGIKGDHVRVLKLLL